MADYLSAAALANLRHYKYSAVDKSPLSNYVLRHYWNYMVTMFPLWMAPNLITLIGFGFVCMNLLCAVIIIPDFIGPGPSWLYFSFALGIWLYSTFDNVDGKQARRTGTSSPLGELFDHGCDALNCSVGSLVQVASLASGCTWYAYGTVFIAMGAFFLTTWEEYHTGTLYLGYINGPTEGLLLACVLSVISGILGPTVWRTPVRLPVAVAKIWPFPTFVAVQSTQLLSSSTSSVEETHVVLLDLLVVSLLFLLVTTHVPFCLWNVYRSTKRRYTFVAALCQMMPTVLFFAANIFWLSSPHSVALSNHMVLFLLASGLVFGRMVTKVILAHVTRMSFPMFSTKMLIPLFFGAFLVNVPRILGYAERH